MIDLHCHLLPGIDDGARDSKTALEMARIAVNDGIEFIACTPHIYPGVYENDKGAILSTLQKFKRTLKDHDIDLRLGFGADTHLVPEMIDGLNSGRIPTLNGTRYFLLEPPHHVAPPQFRQLVFNTMAAGYVPLITHPERLTWADEHYEDFQALAREGAWIQVTAGALTGRFGRGAKYLAEQMLDDGIVHVIATDAHNLGSRPPLLAEGRDAAAKWVGNEEAQRMVMDRPRAILEDRNPDQVDQILSLREGNRPKKRKGFFSRVWPFE